MTREIREMAFSEVDLMINYFLNASDEYLSRLGVDRQKLPTISFDKRLLCYLTIGNELEISNVFAGQGK